MPFDGKIRLYILFFKHLATPKTFMAILLLIKRLFYNPFHHLCVYNGICLNINLTFCRLLMAKYAFRWQNTHVYTVFQAFGKPKTFMATLVLIKRLFYYPFYHFCAYNGICMFINLTFC